MDEQNRPLLPPQNPQGQGLGTVTPILRLSSEAPVVTVSWGMGKSSCAPHGPFPHSGVVGWGQGRPSLWSGLRVE